MERPLELLLFGAGNLAHHLLPALLGAGHRVRGVAVRSPQAWAAWAEAHGTRALPIPERVPADLDLCLLAVADDAIPLLASSVDFGRVLVAHCSGGQGIERLRPAARAGVFYPLQTFTKNKPLDFKKIPIFIEAQSPEDLALLARLGQQIGAQALPCPSEQRAALHVAAVFACNFSNHMFSLAEEILRQSGMAFALLKPLLAETLEKSLEMDSPRLAQTGPARRADLGVMAKHLALLDPMPDNKKLYSFVSASILKSIGKWDDEAQKALDIE